MTKPNMNGLAFLCVISLIFTNICSSLRFRVSKDNKLCFLESFKEKTFPLITYKISGYENFVGTPHVDSILRSVSIVFNQESDNFHVHTEVVKSPVSKFTVKINNDGLYRICVTQHGGYWAHQVSLEMQLKINNQTSTEQYSDVLKKDQIGELHGKIISLIARGQSVLESKNIEIDLEEQDAKWIVRNHTNLIYFSLTQVAVIMVLFIYQIISLWRVMDRYRHSWGSAHKYI